MIVPAVKFAGVVVLVMTAPMSAAAARGSRTVADPLVTVHRVSLRAGSGPAWPIRSVCVAVPAPDSVAGVIVKLVFGVTVTMVVPAARFPGVVELKTVAPASVATQCVSVIVVPPVVGTEHSVSLRAGATMMPSPTLAVAAAVSVTVTVALALQPASAWAPWTQAMPAENVVLLPVARHENVAAVLSQDRAAQSPSCGVMADPSEITLYPTAGHAIAPVAASCPPVGLALAPAPLSV